MDLAKFPKNRQLTADILQYFLTNPQATDSLEGILRWRMSQVVVRRTSREVEDALDWMVAHGYLMERLSSGSGPTYCLNGERRTDAERMLANLLGEVDDPER